MKKIRNLVVTLYKLWFYLSLDIKKIHESVNILFGAKFNWISIFTGDTMFITGLKHGLNREKLKHLEFTEEDLQNMSFLQKISMKKVRIIIFLNFTYIFEPHKPFFWGISKVLILLRRTVIPTNSKTKCCLVFTILRGLW